MVDVDAPNKFGSVWTWNGDAESPSFSPSVNTGRCHYVIAAGSIYFCADSYHDMRGLTVPMPDFPPHILDRNSSN